MSHHKKSAVPTHQKSDSVPAAEVTKGGKEGAVVCAHCCSKFSSKRAGPAGGGGCGNRRFHTGTFDSGLERLWTGPDYVDVEARAPSWTCCGATHREGGEYDRGGCRALPHVFKVVKDKPPKGESTQEPAEAKGGEKKFCKDATKKLVEVCM